MPVSNQTPLVTVVIPTYNRMPLILEAIDSVIAQTYTNWELFVVDDGSTDDTVAAVQALNDPRIHILDQPHTGLPGVSRNKGAQKGTGEWICFLDSDDIWLPEKLECQLKVLQETGFECCYTNFELMNENGKIIAPKAGAFKPYSGNIVKELLATETTITIVSVMLSRKLFDIAGGFSEIPSLIQSDYEFELRVACNAEIVGLPDVLLKVREHAARTTNTIAAADLHTSAALAYEMFITGGPEKELKKIARYERSKRLRAAIKLNFRSRKYLQASKLLLRLLN